MSAETFEVRLGKQVSYPGISSLPICVQISETSKDGIGSDMLEVITYLQHGDVRILNIGERMPQLMESEEVLVGMEFGNDDNMLDD